MRLPFTLKQLEDVKALHSGIAKDKNYMLTVFAKRYFKYLDQEAFCLLSPEEQLDSRKQLAAKIKAEKLPAYFNQAMVFEIMRLNDKLGIYDVELFKTYAKAPMLTFGVVHHYQTEGKMTLGWENFAKLLGESFYLVVIRRHLQRFVRQGVDIF